jgi:flavin reductase (DIM6/NTAB) family NADH-FMN oxidoreductase RutF
VLTTINKGCVPDAATFAWVSSVSFNPPLISIAISPKRYTWHNLREVKEFVVNIPTAENLNSVWYVGTRSGRNEPDKIANSGFTTTPSDYVRPPKLRECAGWIECRVRDMITQGDHDIIVGEILGGEVKDELWDSKKKIFLLEKVKLIRHLGGRKFMIGEKLVEV